MNRRWTRRRWIESAGAFTLGATLPGCKTKEGNLEPVVVRAAPVVTAKVLDSLLEDLQERTFNFFWDTAEPETGLIPDRWPRPPFSSMNLRMASNCAVSWGVGRVVSMEENEGFFQSNRRAQGAPRCGNSTGKMRREGIEPPTNSV